ncbi:MAG: hypothetical protein INH41_05370 [Myxococcaceae bacterium]|jgi:hypothetical protein|nr:hypothetical protein [Myxococcaceae bacterium]MCA3011814.1 hypothetical protein [Myxococcaceae bacterium]
MNTREVEGKALTGYLRQLNQLRNEAEALARVAPPEGLAIIERFIAGLPMVFDRVHEERELAELNDSLTEGGIATASKAGVDVVLLATGSIDAFSADGTTRWTSAVGTLTKAPRRGGSGRLSPMTPRPGRRPPLASCSCGTSRSWP